ncbi:PIF1-like helicase-domain-containing protein [Rhodofomes roseus]|uniref:ATP-dependent DNA helicase n=1 Tax=Rhodofomes roseus TaxID=34475 RepID=A0ABQ8KB76_9APHY|nr:PIF1-like helicase-domain-containing protein [Rhodofomes roseus]KAH9834817.1 PIF1-like helicase-domain-containing protein [Rhodofomes roseus]
MARTATTATTITASRKRKSTGDIPKDGASAKDAKRPRTTLDRFFSPQVPVSSSTKGDSNTGTTSSRDTVALNDEQRKILQMVVDEGKNVFFTGAAGTGKSLLLRAIISALRRKHAKKAEVVSVVASTGMAASNIGGMTIHSWGAVTPGMTNIERQISCIKTCKPAFQRWKATKVLVIDEISMVDGELFELLASLGDRLRRKTDKPFGGLQVRLRDPLLWLS